jgi:nucleoside-diphosphate-sugar epimerase
VLDLDAETYARETDPMLSHINVGTGNDISILELAHLVADVTGFAGKIETDPSKPDGTPRKLLDVSRLKRLGWQASIELEEGIRQTYAWFCEREGRFRR